jgi:hypothetical protein
VLDWERCVAACVYFDSDFVLEAYFRFPQMVQVALGMQD